MSSLSRLAEGMMPRYIWTVTFRLETDVKDPMHPMIESKTITVRAENKFRVHTGMINTRPVTERDADAIAVERAEEWTHELGEKLGVLSGIFSLQRVICGIFRRRLY